MEDKKIFNLRDNFFIAEALDSLALNLPVPMHTQKEFDEQPDLYIIWKKISQLVIPMPPPPNQQILFFAKVHLTSAQVKTLNSIPVLVVPNAGANTSIEVISASANLIFNSVAYTSGELSLKIVGVANPQIDTNAFYLSSVANIFERFPTTSSGNNSADNSSLELSADADSLVGDSEIDVNVCYRINIL